MLKLTQLHVNLQEKYQLSHKKDADPRGGGGGGGEWPDAPKKVLLPPPPAYSPTGLVAAKFFLKNWTPLKKKLVQRKGELQGKKILVMTSDR